MINNPLFRLVVIFVMSACFSALVRGRVRDKLTPWFFAFQVIYPNIVVFIGGAAHVFVMIAYWVSMAFLCDGFKLQAFRKNPTFSLFMVFWGYLTFTGVLSSSIYFGVLWYVNVLVELILVGYFVGIWTLKFEDGMIRLLKPLVLLSVISFYFYFKYGFGSALDHTGRGLLDRNLMEEDKWMNVNQIGLSIGPIVVSLLVYVMLQINIRDGRHAFSQKFFKTWSIVMLVVSVYLLIRTGSRNACLALLPCVYFAIKGIDGRRSSVIKRYATIGLIVLSAVIVIHHFMREAAEIRAFKFMESGQVLDLDAMSSGRTGEFIVFLQPMEGIDYIIGQGPLVSKSGNGVGGALSVYVTLFRFCGLIGLVLLSIFMLKMSGNAFSSDGIRRIAFLLFAVWAITGVAEGSNIRRGYTMTMLLGMSLALCTNRRPFEAVNNCQNIQDYWF